MKARHIAFILFIDLLWAINIVAIKESVAVIPPLLAVALRYVVLLVACALHLRIVPGRMGLILLTGIIGGALQFGLGGYAFQVTTNLSALAIAGQLGVPLSLILAIVIDGERIAWRRSAGILLAIAGVMTLVFDPRIADERLGILLTFGASFCWAVATLLFKRLSGIPRPHSLCLAGGRLHPVAAAGQLLAGAGGCRRFAACAARNLRLGGLFGARRQPRRPCRAGMAGAALPRHADHALYAGLARHVGGGRRFMVWHARHAADVGGRRDDAGGCRHHHLAHGAQIG